MPAVTAVRPPVAAPVEVAVAGEVDGDEVRHVNLDGRQIRVLAHPLRSRLLSQLRLNGAATHHQEVGGVARWQKAAGGLACRLDEAQAHFGAWERYTGNHRVELRLPLAVRRRDPLHNLLLRVRVEGTDQRLVPLWLDPAAVHRVEGDDGRTIAAVAAPVDLALVNADLGEGVVNIGIGFLGGAQDDSLAGCRGPAPNAVDLS